MRHHFLVILSLFFLTSHAFSADLYVTPEGIGDGSISSPVDLQTALDTARTNGQNDIIHLAQGTYDAGASLANTFTYGTLNVGKPLFKKRFLK